MYPSCKIVVQHLFRFSCKNESQTFLFRPTAAVIHVQNITFNKIPEENIKGNFY